MVTDMTEKAFAVLLALIMIFSAVPLASANTGEDGWLLYCEDIDENSFSAIIVAPAKYTRLSDAPQIGIIDSFDPSESSVLTPEAERIEFSFNGRTETRWTMTVPCPAPDGSAEGYFYKLAVLPGSVFDDAGSGNPRVFFDDLTEYLEAEGYADIDVYSSLLRRDYDRADDTVAVGDTLRVDYSGLYPVEIFVNGGKAASLPGGEMQRYTLDIVETGVISVSVRQGEEEIETRTVTVISSKEMYERNLRDGLITGEDIPSTEDLVDVGVPYGSPFILIAKIVAFFNAVSVFFRRLLSFTRIADR